jgi:hypothetical protein
MSSPHEVWEFGWSQPYEQREAYIKSLPEWEQEWVRSMFIYIDLAFSEMVYHRTSKLTTRDLPSGNYSDRVEEIRQWAKDRLEPKTKEGKDERPENSTYEGPAS